MKRYLAISLAVAALVLAVAPSHAQFMKKLGENLLGVQGQDPMMGQTQNSLIGQVNLPPGQYMMSNVQTGQAFYVVVQSGQMYLSSQPVQQNFNPGLGQGFGQGQGQGLLQPQQQNGVGGMLRNGLGSFLKNQMAPQQPVPDQY